VRPIRVSGATRYLGAPADWKDDGRAKDCGFLAIRDEQSSVGTAMTSAWELEPHEVAAMAKGAPLYLTICGTGHPPVQLKIGATPEEVVA
jgi:hypothetical protein